jgi:hypothetical protein
MSKMRSPEELQILWMMLDIEFMHSKPATHEAVADQVIELILWKERLRTGLETTIEDQHKSDIATIAALKTMDTADPQLVVIEKVFRQLVTDRRTDAMKLIKASIENKYSEVSIRQQKNGKEPRPKNRHPLSFMVDYIVEKKPEISVHELFKALLATSKATTESTCTYNFEKAAFIPRDKKFKPVPKNNLSDYLYRAKERIKRANRLGR